MCVMSDSDWFSVLWFISDLRFKRRQCRGVRSPAGPIPLWSSWVSSSFPPGRENHLSTTSKITKTIILKYKILGSIHAVWPTKDGKLHSFVFDFLFTKKYK